MMMRDGFDNRKPVPLLLRVSKAAAFETDGGELKWLSRPKNLERRLASLDRVKPLKRIYVMGCGRSGTWLLTSVMSTFADVCVVAREIAVENFGMLSTDASTLVIKRKFNSFLAIEKIPQPVRIAYIVRHPFDVLTSHNPTTKRCYHIAPHRWLGEMLALQFLIDTERPHTRIIRYEDLVADADAVQADLAAYFELSIAAPVDAITSTFAAPSEATAAMHGLRAIDAKSVNKFAKDPEKIHYLKSIRPRLGRMLEWVAHAYGYDVSL